MEVLIILEYSYSAFYITTRIKHHIYAFYKTSVPISHIIKPGEVEHMDTEHWNAPIPGVAQFDTARTGVHRRKRHKSFLET